jgi:hypothetical protein
VQEARELVDQALSQVKYFVRIDWLADKIQEVGRVYDEAMAAGDPLSVPLLDGARESAWLLRQGTADGAP